MNPHTPRAGLTAQTTNVPLSAEPYGQYRYQEQETIAGRFYVHACAEGGHGHIYLCYDREHDYFYALKTPKLDQAALDDPRTWQRLQREARAWIELGEHDNIVRCFALEIIDNLPFIVLEWVADTDLLSHLYRWHHSEEPIFLDWYARMGRQGVALRRQQANRNRHSVGAGLHEWLENHRQLEPAWALRIALDICAGLAHANSIHPRFVHRDLKPANILLTEQLRAKVTDFGLSIDGQNSLDSGTPVGTWEYMAPEQWRGEAKDVRTDIYAVGCILYEMLAGYPPFSSSTTGPNRNRAELRQQHEYAPLPCLPSPFPIAINKLIQTCIQKEPRDRFASLNELTAALKAVYTSGIDGNSTTSVTQSMSVEESNLAGITYYNLEKFEQALAAFNRAEELDAIYPNTFNNRGCVHHMMGAPNEALADYARAIRLGRSTINGKVHNNRGLLYLQMGQAKRGLRDLDKAIHLEPEYANVFANRGLAYSFLGDYPAALTDFGRALELNPKHVLGRYNRGYVYLQLGDVQAAIADFNTALECDPTFGPAFDARSRLYMQLGKEIAARQDRQQADRLRTEVTEGEELREIAPQLGRPDPQMVNVDSIGEIIARPFETQRVNMQYWDDLFGMRVRPTGQLPLQFIVSVAEASYADHLHASVLKKQQAGHRLTQVTVRGRIIQGDALSQPSDEQLELAILLDEEAMRAMAARDLQTIYDLKHYWLTLRNDYPDDPDHPLRIAIVH